MVLDKLIEIEEEHRLEVTLRTDYGKFLDNHKKLLSDFAKAYKALEEAHNNYGWEFDAKEVMDCV
jgi:hypothetical protein